VENNGTKPTILKSSRFLLWRKSVSFCKGNITFDEYLSYLKSIDDVELHRKGYGYIRYGGISIFSDIYGTEIAICGGPFIENYEYYNMSKSESELLFETIKSKIRVY
jgi:hypothetical protein